MQIRCQFKILFGDKFFKQFLNTFTYNHAVIHLQFLAYGSWDSLFPISMRPTVNL